MSENESSFTVERKPVERPSRRHERSQRQTRGRSIYDWVVISFLLLTPSLGMIVFGGSRIWSFGPLILCTFLATVLFFGRAIFSEERHLLRFPPGLLFFMIFGVYAFVAIFLSTVPHESKVEWLKVASYIMAFWMWSMVSFPYKRWRVLFGWVLLLISLICLYALILHGKELRWVLNLERPDVYEMRASGTYICPNHFAHLIEIGMCMALALLLMPASGAVLRIIAAYQIIVSIPVLFLTHSRSGWLGAVAGVSVTALLLAWQKSKKMFFTLFLCIPVGLFIFGAILWNYSPDFQERIKSASPTAKMSTAKIRLQLWQDALPMIKEKPAIGFGPGTFRWHYGRFQSFKEHLWARYVHNEYIHLLVDYGITGFILFAIFWVVMLWYFSSRMRRASGERDRYLIAGVLGAVAASMVHALFDYNFHLFANNHLLVMFGGIAAGALYTSGTKTTRQASPKLRAGIGIGVCIVSILIMGTTVRAFLANGFFRLGENEFAKSLEDFDQDVEAYRNRLNTASNLFQKSIAVDSKYWEPRVIEGKIVRGKSAWGRNEVQRAKAAKALVSFEAAYALNPYDADLIFQMGKAYQTLDEPDPALKYLELATIYDPRNPEYLNHYGGLLNNMGQIEKALEMFNRSLAVARISPQARAMADANVKMIEKQLKRRNQPPK